GWSAPTLFDLVRFGEPAHRTRQRNPVCLVGVRLSSWSPIRKGPPSCLARGRGTYQLFSLPPTASFPFPFPLSTCPSFLCVFSVPSLQARQVAAPVGRARSRHPPLLI